MILHRLIGITIFTAFSGTAVLIWFLPTPEPVANRPVRAPLTATIDDHSEKLHGLIDMVHERPLFDISRRPVLGPESTPAPTVEMDHQRPSLVGVISDGGIQTALLRQGNDPQIARVQAGQIFGDWQIVAVSSQFVEISLDGAASVYIKLGE